MTDPTTTKLIEPKTPPAAIPDIWIGGAMIACERIYKDESGLYVLAGTFNRISMQIPWPMQLGASLPFVPGQLFIRFNMPKSIDFSWSIWRRIISWTGSTEEPSKIFADGKCKGNDESYGIAEFAINGLGGMTLTKERLEKFDRNKNGVMVMQYELYAEQKFLNALNLIYVYTIPESIASYDSPSSISDNIDDIGAGGSPSA